MNTRSLKQEIADNPTLKSDLLSYSCNPELYITNQKEALRKVQSLLERMEQSKIQPFEIAQILSTSIFQFIGSTCSLLESTVNYYAYLINPISRYNYFSCIEETEVNHKTLEANLFRSHDQKNNYTNIPLSSINKLKLLIAFYMNQISIQHSSENTYPLSVPLNTDSILSIEIPNKLPKFNIQNTFGIDSNYGIVFKNNQNKISLSLIIKCVQVIVNIRNSSVHARPYRMTEKISHAIDVDQDLQSAIKNKLNSESFNLLKTLLDSFENNDQSIFENLSSSNELLDVFQNVMEMFISTPELYENGLKIVEHLLLASLSRELTYENEDAAFLNNPQFAYIFTCVISISLKIASHIMNLVIDLVNQINIPYDPSEMILEKNKFQYLPRKIEIENVSTIKDAIFQAKRKEFGNERATLFDVGK